MNIPINSISELIYLIVFVLSFNVVWAFFVYSHASLKKFISQKVVLFVYVTVLIAVITSISIFYAENSEFDDLVEGLQSRVTNLESQLDGCLDFAESLNEYELQTAIRTHFEGFRYAVLIGNAFVMIVSSVFAYCYIVSENTDYIWLMLIGVVVSSFLGGIAIGTIDVFTHTQDLLDSESSVANIFTNDCIDPGFTKTFDLSNPNDVEHCNELIELYSCAIKYNIEKIIKFNIDNFTTLAWMAGIIPPLSLALLCTCLLYFKPSETTATKYEKVDFTATSF